MLQRSLWPLGDGAALCRRRKTSAVPRRENRSGPWERSELFRGVKIQKFCVFFLEKNYFISALQCTSQLAFSTSEDVFILSFINWLILTASLLAIGNFMCTILSFCRSVCPVNCGKTAERILIPFVLLMGWVGPGMRNLKIGRVPKSVGAKRRFRAFPIIWAASNCFSHGPRTGEPGWGQAEAIVDLGRTWPQHRIDIH